MVFISEERIIKLERILANYPDILSEYGIKELIVKTYKFEKPVTSIELYSKKTDKIAKFIEELEEFFFVAYVPFPVSQNSEYSGLIFISRFRNLFDVAINYTKEHNGVLDEFADLSGILYGYSSKEIADYCSEERLKKYNLIR